MRTAAGPAASARVAPRPASRVTAGAADARLLRRRRRRRAVGVLTLLLLTAALLVAAAGVWRSGVLDVGSVHVTGIERTGEEDVLTAVGPVLGTPLPLVDVEGTRERVASLPLVAGVRVSRRWPSTLLVSVTERAPVATVPHAGGLVLVDADGVVLERVAGPTAGAPLIEVDLAAGTAPLRASRAVWQALPAELAAQVTTIRAGSPADVTLVLGDGRQVRWGTAEDSALKAGVTLALLRTTAARTYDVSAPGAPATSG